MLVLNVILERIIIIIAMKFKVAIFSLNQWALDFRGNTQRIIKSIELAQQAKASYRAGPELEICGYSCEDAFYETDTVRHSWLSLLNIIKHTSKADMIIDIGMPVYYGSLYNCRVLILHGRIIAIRAKTSLAKEGNYREHRHFIPWNQEAGLTSYRLPDYVSSELDQDYVPFGADFILELGFINSGQSIRIGWEICQELWDLNTVSARLYQNFGCHLILNGSGSYWELRKLNTVVDLIKGLSLRGGAVYGFSNHIGCDGQRYVFYGRSCIFDRGEVVAMTTTSSELLEEVQMITHIVDLKGINEFRNQAGIRPDYSKYPAKTWDLRRPPCPTSSIDSSYKILYYSDFLVSECAIMPSMIPDIPMRFEMEIHLYVSLWLWDYLRRSKMKGFMMPLSGGLDSSTVAVLVYGMCNLVHSNLHLKEVKSYFKDCHQIDTKETLKVLTSPNDISHRLLRCSYLSTKYSSDETQRRARILCDAIGAEYVQISFQDVYSNLRDKLRSSSKDDTNDEVTILDQNLQARLRMTATYYLSGGDRIVLATGNVDEGIVGYLTKYDCSSADINPIGGLCKNDLRSYLNYCCCTIYEGKTELVGALKEIIDAPPSAELTGSDQRDEDEIGITYDEIAVLGRVRRGIFGSNGPLGAFELIWEKRHTKPFCEEIRCLRSENGHLTDSRRALMLADLVKRFFTRYGRNRHKLTVLTPALHAETYSPDDNRFDHRHFLYAPWTEQFSCIDQKVTEISNESRRSSARSNELIL